ncbi:11166_t:CDS:2, partial [Gigaspora rosea]
YQSLNAKLGIINDSNLGGISIADITKDSNDSQLMNFIASGIQPAPAPGGRPNTGTTSPSTPTSSSSNHTGAIVGGGIAIADITKDSNDSQLMNFIASGTQSTSTPGGPSITSSTSSNNTGAIVGGVIGSLIFLSIIATIGFMLYRKRRVEMSYLLKDTKNQTCSDINRQDCSDINRQVRPDTHNRIYSDTNHQAS